MFDRYGAPITLTFNNDEKYKTAFGGCLSIICWIIIASYLGYYTNDYDIVIINYIFTIDVYSYKFSINSQTKQTDIIRDTTIINLKDHFDAAYQAIYNGEDPYIQQNIDLYISFFAQQYKKLGNNEHG